MQSAIVQHKRTGEIHRSDFFSYRPGILDKETVISYVASAYTIHMTRKHDQLPSPQSLKSDINHFNTLQYSAV